MKKILALLGIIILPFFAIAKSLDEKINEGFAPISKFVTDIVFYEISIAGIGVPIVLIVLLIGATFFTFYFGFVNIRKFVLAFKVVQGKYDEMDAHAQDPIHDPDLYTTDEGDIVGTERVEGHIGEVTHFQALTAALSATVGLGNIAGVAIAIVLGGPGATFWMILAGLLGMSSKFTECTLGVKYREFEKDGTAHGGPMYYLRKGLSEKGLASLGKVLAVFFAIMTIGGSFGGGNMFQANQAAQQFKDLFGLTAGYSGVLFGIIMAILVGVVIIGGIKRIGGVAAKIVPIMAVIYVGAALVIIVLKINELPHAFNLIFAGAFNFKAVTGGAIGAMIVGFQRAAFSNEAGIGSAAIAHAAVKTRFPASEGIVAMIGPFFDTVVICTMTALVIILTNNYGVDIAAGVDKTELGVQLTSQSFDTVIPHFSILLTIAVILFAFSSMLSWSYYGLQSWKFLFGRTKIADMSYKVIFLIFVVIGSAASLGSVVDFSDAMIFAMLFPNMIGLVILAPVVKKEFKKYMGAIDKFEKKKA